MAGAGRVAGAGESGLVREASRRAVGRGAAGVEGSASASSEPGRGAWPAVSPYRPEVVLVPELSPAPSREPGAGALFAPRASPRARPVSRVRNDEPREGAAGAGASAGGDEDAEVAPDGAALA